MSFFKNVFGGLLTKEPVRPDPPPEQPSSSTLERTQSFEAFLPPPDLDFRMDAAGQQLRALWTEYVQACEQAEGRAPEQAADALVAGLSDQCLGGAEVPRLPSVVLQAVLAAFVRVTDQLSTTCSTGSMQPFVEGETGEHDPSVAREMRGLCDCCAARLQLLAALASSRGNCRWLESQGFLYELSRLVDVVIVSLGAGPLCAMLLNQCAEATLPVFVCEPKMAPPDGPRCGHHQRAVQLPGDRSAHSAEQPNTEVNTVEAGGLKLLLKLFNAMTSVALQLGTPALQVAVLRSLYFYLMNSSPICKAFCEQGGLTVVAGAAILTAEMETDDREQQQRNCCLLVAALAVLAEGSRGNQASSTSDVERLGFSVAAILCAIHCLYPVDILCPMGESLEAQGMQELCDVISQAGINQALLAADVPHVIDVLLRKLAFEGGGAVRTAVVSGIAAAFSGGQASGTAKNPLFQKFHAALVLPESVPVVQVIMMDFAKAMMRADHASTSIWYEHGLWSVVFSDLFFGSPTGDKYSHFAGKRDSVTLRDRVRHFTDFLTSVPDDHCLSVINSALSTLEGAVCKQDAMLVNEMESVLFSVVRKQGMPAAKALFDAELLPRLIPTITQFLTQESDDAEASSLAATLQSMISSLLAHDAAEGTIVGCSSFPIYLVLAQHRNSCAELIKCLQLNERCRTFALPIITATLKCAVAQQQGFPSVDFIVTYMSALSSAAAVAKDDEFGIGKVKDLLDGLYQCCEPFKQARENTHRDCALASLCNAHIFTHVLHVLNVVSEAHGVPMCIEVVKLLTWLMAGNMAMKESFQVEIGFQHLCSCIAQHVKAVEPPLLLFDALFNWLVDGEHDDAILDRTIENPEVLGTIFELITLPKCTATLQLVVVNRLLGFVAHSIVNKSYCCDTGLLGKLVAFLTVTMQANTKASVCAQEIHTNSQFEAEAEDLLSAKESESTQTAEGEVQAAGHETSQGDGPAAQEQSDLSPPDAELTTVREECNNTSQLQDTAEPINSAVEASEASCHTDTRKSTMEDQDETSDAISTDLKDKSGVPSEPSCIEDDAEAPAERHNREMVVSKLIELMQVLGHHCITAVELKSIFGIIATIERSQASASGQVMKILHLLRGMMAKRSGPCAFFTFDGHNASLEVELTWDTWASSKGWGFCSWVRAESLSMLNNVRLQRPTLFYVECEDGTKLHAYFHEEQLCVHSSRRGEVATVVFDEVQLPEKEWHCIAITHSKGNLLSSPKLQCYLDGKLTQSLKFNYTYPPPSSSSGGDSLCTLRIGSQRLDDDSSTTFFGQMGPTYFFNAELSPLQMLQIFESGADGVAIKGVSCMSAISPQIIKAVEDSGISSCITLALDARNWDPGQRGYPSCISNAEQETVWGIARGKVNRCVTQGVSEILPCLGGMSALLPLLQEPTERVGPSFAAVLITETVALLGELMRGSPTNLVAMMRDHGFQVVGLLLQQVPHYITTDLVATVSLLMHDTMPKDSLLSQEEYVALLAEYHQYILLNFTIWAAVDLQVAAAHLRAVTRRIQEAPALYRMTWTVRRAVQAAIQFRKVSLADSDNVLLKSQISQLQCQLISLAELMASDQINPEELQAFLLCLHTSSLKDSPEVVSSGVFALLHCADRNHESSLPVLRECGCLYVFLNLVSHTNDDVSACAIRAITWWLKREQGAPIRDIGTFALVDSALQGRSFARGMSHALLGAVTRSVSVSTAQAFMATNNADGRTQREYLCPPAVMSLLQGLSSASYELKVVVLQELNVDCRENTHTCDVLLEQESWQSHLLALIPSGDPTTTSEEIKTIRDGCRKIFRRLHHHAVVHQPQGWYQTVLRTLWHVRQFSQLNYDGVVTVFLVDLVEYIHTQQEVHRKEHEGPWISNLIHVAVLIEDHIFFNDAFSQAPTSESITSPASGPEKWPFLKRDGNKRWVHWDLLHKLLLLLEELKFLEINDFETLQQRSNWSVVRTLQQSVSVPFAASFAGGFARIVARGAMTALLEKEPSRTPIAARYLGAVLGIMLENWSPAGCKHVLACIACIVVALRCALFHKDIAATAATFTLLELVIERRRAQLEDILVGQDGQTLLSLKFVQLMKQCRKCDSTSFHSKLHEEFYSERSRWSYLLESSSLLCAAVHEEIGLQMSAGPHLLHFQQDIKSAHERLVHKRESTQQTAIDSVLANTKLERHLGRVAEWVSSVEQLWEGEGEAAHRAALQQWWIAYRSITSERSVFGAGAVAAGKDQGRQWKLDNSENSCRERRKLARMWGREKSNRYGTNRSSTGPKGADAEGPVEPSEANREALLNAAKQAANAMDVLEEEVEVVALVEIITPLMVWQGKLKVTPSQLMFLADSTSSSRMGLSEQGLPKNRKWELASIREVHRRRYQMKWSAIEICFVEGEVVFFNFPSRKSEDAAKMILNKNPPNLLYHCKQSPKAYLKEMQQKWQNFELTNFEYLMHLNTLAGRTYNDIAQYPVFPWIIADWTSPELDLTKEETFRDLSKPMGLQNQDMKRLSTIQDNFEGLGYHFLRHYSTSLDVLSYLVRLEPYTELHKVFNDGKFDLPDRMFNSIPTSFANIMINMQDLKELIPEFFFLPEFLINVNSIDLGTLQTGKPVNDVQLPPWASSPHDFIKKHRDALESTYVSEHLHLWIDLIFGYRQTGDAAVEALNMFNPQCYEGYEPPEEECEPDDSLQPIHASDLVGQCPSQLFSKPHPRRSPNMKTLPLLHNVPLSLKQAELCTVGPTVHVVMLSDRLIFVCADQKISMLRWRPSFDSSNFWVDSTIEQPVHFQLPFESTVANRSLSSCVSSVVMSEERVALGSCGHWDNTWHLHIVGRDKSLRNMRKSIFSHHKNVVTALHMVSMSDRIIAVVTGSKDTTVMVWEVDTSSKAARTENKPTHILFGHDDEVTAVAADYQYDVVASCSLDGTCMLHTLRSGQYVLTIQPPGGQLGRVAISPSGYVIIFSRAVLKFYLYSINGAPLGDTDVLSGIQAMHITADGDFLVTGDDRGQVSMRCVHSLQPVELLQSKAPLDFAQPLIKWRERLGRPPASDMSLIQAITIGPGPSQDYLVGALANLGVVVVHLTNRRA